MNRENKRKTFEKGYYKTHACNDTFTCKVCGRVCTPQNAGSDHRNHCPNCLSSLHVDEICRFVNSLCPPRNFHQIDTTSYENISRLKRRLLPMGKNKNV